jgi:Protein of unknown function (DUF2510)
VSMPPSIPPGWYADPGSPGSATQRWWSGVAWTEHVTTPALPVALATSVASTVPTQAATRVAPPALELMTWREIFTGIRRIGVRNFFRGMRTSERPPIDDYPALKFLRDNKALVVTSHVFEAATIVLLFAQSGILALGVLELLVAITTLVLDIVVLARRRHIMHVSFGSGLLQLSVGIIGIGWFVWVFVRATALFISQHPY